MSSLRTAAESFLGAPRFTHALATAAIGTSILSVSLRSMIGWPGLVGIVAALFVLAGLSLFARREAVEWQGVLPLSLLLFLAWTSLSVFWSQYQWASLGGIAYLLAFSGLGLYVALVRDTIQIVRAFGDVLRFVLVASMVLEVLSGLLIDSPIGFLGIQGNLANGGPIQGLLGGRNQLGIVALVAAVTFGTEWRTRSTRPGVAIGSLALAGATMVFSRSPLIGFVVVVLGAAIIALYALRRVDPARRTIAQLALLALAAVIALLVWLARGRLVQISNAGGELNFRLVLWQQVVALIGFNPLEGWGWVGYWRAEIVPFPAFTVSERVPVSALNAYLDVWFQVGLVGAVIFVGLTGLTFVRSWLLAGKRRSVVFAWPALVLVVLLTSALFESSLLVEYGWLTFVVCCVKASQSLSWRTAFVRPLVQEPLD
jgi:O-antigen ligase